MIQRIQTVYLLIALILAVLGFFFDWVVYTTDAGSEVLKPFSNDAVSNSTLTFLLALLSGVLVATIVQFKQRKQQMRNAKMSIVASLLVLTGFALDHYLNIQEIGSAQVEMNYGFAVVLPILCAVLSWMAFKAIKKDEDLVKSVDRLR
jgi:O-antigen/teichoic acid export membrane protein